MKLNSFRVRKFRNIVDSGSIEVDSLVTCMVGKNEAGKSGILEALYLLNPAYGEKFSIDEQYPRWQAAKDRRAGDLNEHYPIEAVFTLTESDKSKINEKLGTDAKIGDVATIKRSYGNKYDYAVDWDIGAVYERIIGQFPDSVKLRLKGSKYLQDITKALDELDASDDEDGPDAVEISSARQILKKELGGANATSVLHTSLNSIMPSFFRFTAYSTLPGRIDLNELVNVDEGPATTGLQTAIALLQLAGTEISQLKEEDYELRRSEIEAVQIDLTQQVFEYWKQNPHLEVVIDIDKETISRGNGTTAVSRFLDIRLKDRRTGYSNNFSQRSSGFQWFFSFLAAFSEFEDHDAPIVLLDEPALTLHGKAQADFLRFINERLAPSTPVIYTTHSPFMVEAGHLERVRIVEDQGPPLGATCSSEILATDPDSLFPLQAALGYDIAQSLFVGPHNLIVEGSSDFIYLSVMSEICSSTGRSELDARWRLLPAGGATNIATFVSLVGPHLNVTVLADSDTKGMQKVSNMVGSGLLKENRLILASAATEKKNADIEDLFTEGDYLKIFNKTFGVSLKVSDLPDGDRVVKRIERKQGKEFVHGKVAETLLRKRSEFSLTDTTLDRFSNLFNIINSTLS